MNNVDIGHQYKKIVQYFWDPEPKNDDTAGLSVWCLGQEYQHVGLTDRQSSESGSSGNHAKPQQQAPNGQESTLTPQHLPPLLDNSRKENNNNEPVYEWPARFLDDFESRFWITYRSHFPPIPKSSSPDANSSMALGVRLRSQLLDTQGFTTDTGWGCMIRSGQSLLANALSVMRLGRDWRRCSKTEEESKLLSMFADDPRAPFSIHRFVEHGATACGKYPGEWFGPSATARCIQALSEEYKYAGINVFISDGPDVNESSFLKEAGKGNCDINPTLLLLGVRLGIDRVTPVYWDALKSIIRYPQSVGIAGGRPSSSHYFIGVQSSHFFYLDPHHCRPALPYKAPPAAYSEDELNTYHTRRLRRLHLREMDPSMLIGFLIKDKDDWADWKERVRGGPGKPIFHIFDEISPLGQSIERAEALDEVEAFDDDDDDDDDD